MDGIIPLDSETSALLQDTLTILCFKVFMRCETIKMPVHLLCSLPNNYLVTLVHYRLNIFEIVSRIQNHTPGLDKELFLNFCFSYFKLSQMIATILVFYRKSNCRR